jgi:hypothetical protein
MRTMRVRVCLYAYVVGVIPMKAADLEEALEMGMDWSLREGYV